MAKNEISTISQSTLAQALHGFDSTIPAFSREILLMQTQVNGTNHVSRIRQNLKETQVGDKLILIRQPKNPYDERAILVRNSKNHKLGYIPRYRNEVLSNLMDAGKKLYARVDTIIPRDEKQRIFKDTIYITVYMED